jgi:hypothetical protein
MTGGGEKKFYASAVMNGEWNIDRLRHDHTFTS